MGDNKKLKQKSPAEFFADNKNIAGFDNPGKSLYTTIRELVENSLDAAESAGTLPDIDLTIEEISQRGLNAMRGMGETGRRDDSLYHDYETDAQRKKREEKEAKELERKVKAARTKAEAEAKKKGGDAKEAGNAAEAEARAKGAQDGGGRGRAGAMFYRIRVKDNGAGMSHNDIPNMLGKVLSGTKYGVKQTRGKFGLGSKMVLIWSKMSTGLPIEVWSARSSSATISYYKLDIDIHKNEPNVHKQEHQANPAKWRGSEIVVTIEGQWSAYRHKVVNYLRQLAIITPYSTFNFKFDAEEPKNSVSVRFARRTDAMPELPSETKYHPSAVNIELIKTLVAGTKAKRLALFLQKEFACINKDMANRLVNEMGKDFDPDMDPKELSNNQVNRIYELFKQVKFSEPDGSCLSPAGEYNLRLGVLKEIQPDMVATYQGSVGVFEGHPFVVEAAVSIGGRDVKPGVTVYRFANRIPLLWEGGGDVATRTANKRINWGGYKIGSGKDNTDKVGVFVSIVSTKIPFKGTSKEYVGDDIPQMVAAVKAAIQNCAVQLKSKIARVQAAQERQQRKKNLVKYIPDVCRAVFGVLEEMADAQDKKRGREEPEVDVVSKVARGEVTEATLVERLREHVDQVDTELSLAYHTAAGMKEMGKEGLYLVPTAAIHELGPELHHPCCVVRLLE